jgi:PIN domain nuclease of toxin-antitoxin system
MILLDTHIWVWWVADETRLTQNQLSEIKKNEDVGIGISIISCWETALLVEKKRLGFTIPIREWLKEALNYPGVVLLDITVEIAIDSVQLPGAFHKDPADRIIVATARAYNCSLLTNDHGIVNYPHVKVIT